jgi:hypothetical protein
MRRRPGAGPRLAPLLAVATALGAFGCQRKPVNDAWFADIAEGAGITFRHDTGADGNHRYIEVLPGGVAVLDIDSDGLQDLIYVQSGPSTRDRSTFRESTLRVYRNRGLLKFDDITTACGLAGDYGYAHGIAVADIDSDQRPDVFVTSLQGNRLFRNIDGKRYADVTEAWGLAGKSGYGTSAVFGDIDGDKRPDLFVCRYAQWDYENTVACSTAGLPDYCPPDRYAPATNLLFRNTGSRFENITERSNVGSIPGRSLVASIRDLDGDRDNDILVGTDLTGNQVWMNNGRGVFTERGSETGLAVRADGQRMATMGIATAFEGESTVESLFLTDFSGSPNPLFRPLGAGLYEDVSGSAGLAAPTAPWVSFGTTFLDFDNDSHSDVAIANGHVTEHADKIEAGGKFRQPQLLLRNNGRGVYEPVPVAKAPDFAKPALGRGLVGVDLDNDGRRDLVIVRQGETPRILHNRHPKPGHWIGFTLKGRTPGTDAFGAVVEVTIGGKTRRGAVAAGESYLSTGDRRIHFGLGEIHALDKIVVRWPDGATQEVANPKVDRYHTVVQAP